MIKINLFLAFLVIGSVSWAVDLRPCRISSNCNHDEICISYTGCEGKQVKRCISRACYRDGVGCPSDLICVDQHCSELGCRVSK